MIDCKECVCRQRKEYIQAHPERRSYLKPEIKERKLAKWRENYWKNPDKFREIGRSTYRKRRDKARARSRERYYANQEAEIERSRRWNRENPEKVKNWVRNNRDKVNASVRKYARLNPEASKISRDIRRARKFNAVVTRLRIGYANRLLNWQNFKCPYCSVDLRTVENHEDHLIPLAKGGEHSERNLQITCKRCNLHKHAKHPLDFAAECGIAKDPTLIPI